MLNLNDLYYFVRVVEQKGFSAAARLLSVPKSTLSKRIAELESHLGARLINRSTRGFRITDVGEDFYRRAVVTLTEAESAEAAVKNRLAEPSGMVRVTASIAATHLLLADVLPALARTFPKIQLSVHTSNRYVDLVREGYDLALRGHHKPLPDSDLIQRRLRKDRLCLVASPDYLSQRGIPQRPEELAEHDCLMGELKWPYVWRLRHAGGSIACVEPTPKLFANETLTLLKAVYDGCGVACLPMLCCKNDLENGRLVRVLPEWYAGTVYTTLLMQHGRGQLPSVRKVADFLIKTIGNT